MSEMSLDQVLAIGAIVMSFLVSLLGAVFVGIVAFVTVKTNQKHMQQTIIDNDDKINGIKSLLFTHDGGTNFVRQVDCIKAHSDLTGIIRNNVSDQNSFNAELNGLKSELKTFGSTALEQSKTIQALRQAVVEQTKASNQIAIELAKLPGKLIPGNGKKYNRNFSDFFNRF